MVVDARHWWWLPLVMLVGLTFVATYATWIIVSYTTFPNRVRPGGTYRVADHAYQVPALPHKTYQSPEPASLDRPVPMLNVGFLDRARTLALDTFQALDAAGVDYWLSGGTLIAAVLWKQINMPWDDDADIHVKMEDREYLWSREWATLVRRRCNLEVILLRGSTLGSAGREGACVRLRRRGTLTPTLDIFFVAERPSDRKWIKLDGWREGGTRPLYNAKERWDGRDWVYPLRRVTVDHGVTCTLPNQAEKMLDRQYGTGWSTVLKSPKPLLATHQFAFFITNLIGVWRVQQVLSDSVPTDLLTRHPLPAKEVKVVA